MDRTLRVLAVLHAAAEHRSRAAHYAELGMHHVAAAERVKAQSSMRVARMISRAHENEEAKGTNYDDYA